MNTCKYCADGRMKPYQNTYSTTLHIGKLGRRWIIETEVNACPPFAVCSRKGDSIHSGFFINFCPECGRDLREEAGS